MQHQKSNSRRLSVRGVQLFACLLFLHSSYCGFPSDECQYRDCLSTLSSTWKATWFLKPVAVLNKCFSCISLRYFSSITTSPTEICRKMHTNTSVGLFRKLRMSLTALPLQRRCSSIQGSFYTPPPDGRESSGLGSPHWLQEFLRAKFMLPQDLGRTRISQTQLLRNSEGARETPLPN